MIVNAAQGNIEAMTLAETVEGTVEGVKANDYLRIGGTPYNYNYAYTTGGILRGYSDTVKGLYDLENSVAANPSAGDEVVIYLDANGSVVAIADAGLVAEDYIYVKGVHLMYGDYSARVVHYDGTEEDVTIDEIDESRAYNASLSGNEYIAYTDTNKMGLGVYKYNASSNDYDLYTEYNNFTGEQFEADALTSVKIENGRARIGQYNDTTKAYYGQSWAVDNNTVFVDVVNNTTWTGYENVPTMSNVEGWAVIDGTNNSVVDVVFITNDNVRYEEDNDSYFVVTSSNPEESLLESSVASRSRAATTRASGTVWTYNVWINGEATTLEASQDLDLSIGVWKITGRDSNGLVKEVEQVLAEGSMIPFANFANFTTFATYRTADSLTLNDKTNSDLSTDVASDKQDHFAITTETVIVVAQMNDDNDEVKDIVPGSLNDIQVANSTNPKDSSTSAVFVLNAEDDDWGTVAKLVLVVNPEPTSEGGSSSVSGVSDFTPVVSTGTNAVTVRYYNVADSDLRAYVENEMSAATGLAVKSYNTLENKITMEDNTHYTVTPKEVFKVSDGVNVTYVDTGSVSIAPGADKLPAGSYLLAGDAIGAAADLVTVNASGNITGTALTSVTKDTNLVAAYKLTSSDSSVASFAFNGETGSMGDYVAEGTTVVLTGTKSHLSNKGFVGLYADGELVQQKELGTSANTYNYRVNDSVDLTEALIYLLKVNGREINYYKDGETAEFTGARGAGYLLKGTDSGTSEAAGIGTSFKYTIDDSDNTNGVIELVEAYQIATQTNATHATFENASSTAITVATTYVRVGATVTVKGTTTAGQQKIVSSTIELTEVVPAAASTAGEYTFVMPTGGVGADAFTEQAPV